MTTSEHDDDARAWTLAGFLVTCEAARAERAAVLPETILSASSCVCPRQPIFDEPFASYAAAARAAPPSSRVLAVGLRGPDIEAILDEVDATGLESPMTARLRSRPTFAAPGAEFEGYELVSWRGGLEHSWLCIGLEAHAFFELGITPGPFGLLTSLADADALAALVHEGKVVSEPGLWMVARVGVIEP